MTPVSVLHRKLVAVRARRDARGLGVANADVGLLDQGIVRPVADVEDIRARVDLATLAIGLAVRVIAVIQRCVRREPLGDCVVHSAPFVRDDPQPCTGVSGPIEIHLDAELDPGVRDLGARAVEILVLPLDPAPGRSTVEPASKPSRTIEARVKRTAGPEGPAVCC